MPIETIVLILALFGSAKIALDTVVSALTAAVRRNQPKPQDPAELAKTLESVVESLDLISKSHSKAAENNAQLQERLLDLESTLDKLATHAVAGTPIKGTATTKRKTSKTSNAQATQPKPQDSEPLSSQPKDFALAEKSLGEEGAPFFMDGDRFEVIR